VHFVGLKYGMKKMHGMNNVKFKERRDDRPYNWMQYTAKSRLCRCYGGLWRNNTRYSFCFL